MILAGKAKRKRDQVRENVSSLSDANVLRVRHAFLRL